MYSKGIKGSGPLKSGAEINRRVWKSNNQKVIITNMNIMMSVY